MCWVPDWPVIHRPVHGPRDSGLVLGNVGQVREITEGPNHEHGLFGAQAVQQSVEPLAGLGIGMAAKGHAQLPNLFHQGEGLLAFLLAQCVAQQAAEESNVVSQGEVGGAHG